jgi:alkylated DNA repair dioxygenase AlkB
MQKTLFQISNPNSNLNLLPKEGCVHYFHKIFDEASSDKLFVSLLNTLTWEHDQLLMFGRRVTTQRKVAWVADGDHSYTYSGATKIPQIWTPELLLIKKQAEALANWKFNSCLLNLYHNGSEGMGWHSDDEPELDQDAPLVSISFGGVRKFGFRNKLDKTSISFSLDHGSALVMYSPTQEYWKHSLLKTKQPVGPRINLTFRSIKSEHESQS